MKDLKYTAAGDKIRASENYRRKKGDKHKVGRDKPIKPVKHERRIKDPYARVKRSSDLYYVDPEVREEIEAMIAEIDFEFGYED